MLIEKSCKDFVEVLSSKEPVPGGGGGGLVGAIGMALGNMVGNLTVGKRGIKCRVGSLQYYGKGYKVTAGFIINGGRRC